MTRAALGLIATVLCTLLMGVCIGHGTRLLLAARTAPRLLADAAVRGTCLLLLAIASANLAVFWVLWGNGGDGTPLLVALLVAGLFAILAAGYPALIQRRRGR